MKAVACLALALWVTAGCANRPPHAFLPPIAEEYYRCEKCGSLHGGIFGKGPIASFQTAAAKRCRHAWRQIPKSEFQALARVEFPKDWATTPEYLTR